MSIRKAFGSIILIGLFAVSSFAEVSGTKISNGGGECVNFARSKVPSLPHNLFNMDQKKAIINSQKPKEGSVAIIDVGNRVGHVAVVVDVDKKGKKKSITLEESNYPSSGVYRRKAAGRDIDELERELRIVGYFRP